MSDILEIIMVVSFGASWPMNVIKAYRSGTAKGMSIAFLILIMCGYTAGILSKFLNPDYMAAFASKWYLLCFYFINMTMVGIDVGVYVRNKKLDAKRARENNLK